MSDDDFNEEEHDILMFRDGFARLSEEHGGIVRVRDLREELVGDTWDDEIFGYAIESYSKDDWSEHYDLGGYHGAIRIDGEGDDAIVSWDYADSDEEEVEVSFDRRRMVDERGSHGGMDDEGDGY